MTAHAGGFTCAQVDEGSQHLADAVSRQREELRGEREKYRQVVEINHANQRSYWAENDALRARLEALRDVAEACAGIPAMFASANVGEISAAEEWVCITCQERNVTSSDQDRCCTQCGMDLTERGELLRFLLAPAPALKPLALVEDRSIEQLAADGDLIEALRAYDAEVIGRRDEVTRLHAELGRVRAELARLQCAGAEGR